MYFTMAEKCLFGFLILFIIFSIIFASMSIYRFEKKEIILHRNVKRHFILWLLNAQPTV